MPRHLDYLPSLLTLLVCALMLIHGPIAQFNNYHDFADQSTWLGIPHAGDVLSNLGFALVALWGLNLMSHRSFTLLQEARYGYGLFLVALLLTAFGSGYYHLAPDNARLVWDRLPIALACAGLLAAVRAETVGTNNGLREAWALGALAVFGVLWWRATDLDGNGDLRFYLLFQILPLVLIPLWQAIHRSPRRDRLIFGLAIILYVLAKLAEVYDHQLFGLLQAVSGHTLKHLLATGAAAVVVANLMAKTSGAEMERDLSTSCCS